MSDMLTRAFEPDLEIQTRAKGGDGRTIVGIAVPYDKPQRIDERLVEQFARGAFNAQLKAAHRVPFARDHMMMGGTLIGRTVELRDDVKGLWGAFRVSNTPTGEETLELVKDGALTNLSIGFREVKKGNRLLPGNVLERVKAELREVAVVLEGAYGEAAKVAAVRSVDGRPNLAEARQMLALLPTLPPL